jgi:hypothetical protein
MRIVSGSRISPTTMTSGAWRSDARSAVGKSGASDADLDLLHHAGVVRVLVLDRILDRDDVARVAAVDLVDQRGQRRRLARPGRAADQHEAARQPREQLHARGQAERGEPRHPRRQRADRGARRGRARDAG